MQSKILALFVALAILLLTTPSVLGRPPHRQKRVSDQRLGELEALLALKKLRGRLVTVPVGFGQIDPNDYGRKRRSLEDPSLASRLFLQQLIRALSQDEPQGLQGATGFQGDVYDDANALPESDAPSRRLSASWERPEPVFSRQAD